MISNFPCFFLSFWCDEGLERIVVVIWSTILFLLSLPRVALDLSHRFLVVSMLPVFFFSFDDERLERIVDHPYDSFFWCMSHSLSLYQTLPTKCLGSRTFVFGGFHALCFFHDKGLERIVWTTILRLLVLGVWVTQTLPTKCPRVSLLDRTVDPGYPAFLLLNERNL